VNRILRHDGTTELLGHIAEAQMQVGDVFEISTPGGGGYGASV
jgi:5-oxoprolinase (ATP-hydrolysing)